MSDTHAFDLILNYKKHCHIFDNPKDLKFKISPTLDKIGKNQASYALIVLSIEPLFFFIHFDRRNSL